MKELKELENAIKETIVYKNKTLAQWEAIADRRDAKLKEAEEKKQHAENKRQNVENYRKQADQLCQTDSKGVFVEMTDGFDFASGEVNENSLYRSEMAFVAASGIDLENE
mgnify:CR=1 FL=1